MAGVAEGVVMAPRVACEGGRRWCGCVLSGGPSDGAVCGFVMDRSGGVLGCCCCCPAVGWVEVESEYGETGDVGSGGEEVEVGVDVVGALSGRGTLPPDFNVY